MKKIKTILLVEDSPGDIWLTREAFRETDSSIELLVVNNGLEALAFLRREGDHARAARPDLILLDLNLPKMDGRELLAVIKNDNSFRTIPTIILTTSQDEADADVLNLYQLQANCYLNKPVGLDAYGALVRSVNEFWLMFAKLPQAMS